jgi:hypothetical protein
MLYNIVIDTVTDSVRIFPFLFLACLLMEFLEHKTSSRSYQLIKKSSSFGPLVGGIIGAFPQCGFSAAASNLYAGRVITLGTLLSIYLSTSDEMLPIFLSERLPISMIVKVLLIKIVIGIFVGFVIDFIFSKKNNSTYHDKIHELCEHEHCHCERKLFLPSLRHTLSILFFIFLVSFCLNLIIGYGGEEQLTHLFINKPVIGQLITGLIGLIPNCAASVVITKLYLEGVLSLGAMFSGLLVGAGIGLLVLVRTNKPQSENLFIIALLYASGVFFGILIDLLL